MAEILTDIPDLSVLPKPQRWRGKYPWDEWLDGRTRLLASGADFTCLVDSLVQQASRTASRRGLRIVYRVTGEGVRLQAVEREATDG